MGLTNLTELTLQIERDLNFNLIKSKEVAEYFLKLFNDKLYKEKKDLIQDIWLCLKSNLDNLSDEDSETLDAIEEDFIDGL